MDFENSNRRKSPELLIRCTMSCFCGISTQLALLLVPRFFPSFSLLSQFLLSAAVFAIAIGLCQFIRILLRVRASAPVFVLFHIIFIWVVYHSVISQAVSLLLNVLLNSAIAILLIGLLRMLTSDPGFVRKDPPSLMDDSTSEDGYNLEELSSTAAGTSLQNLNEAISLSSTRMRYCRSCKAYVLGFDHHCPGFGNCIGISGNLLLKEKSSKIRYSLVVSTLNFSLLQVLWQVVFFAWHVYCVCFNIRTEEWINWRKYPEFHVILHPSSDIRFRNPYNKGIFCNLKDFFLR